MTTNEIYNFMRDLSQNSREYKKYMPSNFFKANKRMYDKRYRPFEPKPGDFYMVDFSQNKKDIKKQKKFQNSGHYVKLINRIDNYSCN
jgi:hypothetical protein